MTLYQWQQIGSVQQKENRAEYRPLRHTARDKSWSRGWRTGPHALTATDQIASEPLKYHTAELICMFWPTKKYVMVNRVEGRGQVYSSTSADRSPASIASNISERTFRMAVSVEWWRRYADRSRGSRPDVLRYANNCRATSRSCSLDETGRGVKIATAGGGVGPTLLTARLIKFYGGLRLMKSTAE